MKLYLVKSLDTGYNQYDAMVIRAESPEDAERIVRTGGAGLDKANSSADLWCDGWPFRGFERYYGVTVTEITVEGPEAIILDSFSAG